MDLIVTAILLGIVEGLTEFIPVSSTGHLILASEIFGYDAQTWAVFNVVIQLGAILAVVVQYWRTFWAVGMGLLRLEQTAIRFVVNLLAAFIPAVVLGLLFKDQIHMLLGSPKVVAWALIAGGVAILAVERLAKPGAYVGLGQLPLRQALGVGVLQCLAMIPGSAAAARRSWGRWRWGSTGVRRQSSAFSWRSRPCWGRPRWNCSTTAPR